jgi:hypothetical protein
MAALVDQETNTLGYVESGKRGKQARNVIAEECRRRGEDAGKVIGAGKVIEDEMK